MGQPRQLRVMAARQSLLPLVLQMVVDGEVVMAATWGSASGEDAAGACSLRHASRMGIVDSLPIELSPSCVEGPDSVLGSVKGLPECA